MIDEILKYNKQFVEEKKYKPYETSKYPKRKLAIVTCMDTRLTELLPAALGLKNGDAKIIKNAGGVITHPFGSAVRSLLIAIYELGVQDIMIVGHTDCGVQSVDYQKMIDKMKSRGITEDSIDFVKYCGVHFESWLAGFEDANTAVRQSMEMLEKHPLIPQDVQIYGYVMDSLTGELMRID